MWTKFTFEDDPVADDLTPRARKEIDDFVDSTFRSRVPAEKVCINEGGGPKCGPRSLQAHTHAHTLLNPAASYSSPLSESRGKLTSSLLVCRSFGSATGSP